MLSDADLYPHSLFVLVLGLCLRYVTRYLWFSVGIVVMFGAVDHVCCAFIAHVAVSWARIATSFVGFKS